MTSLVGQHALVTGANRGIGAEIVRALAAAGANVTLMVRDRASAELVTRELADRTHIAVVGDIADGAAVRAACAEAAKSLGAIDLLVNNAGGVETVPFLKATPELFAQMFAVHVLGAVHTMQAVLPVMLDRHRGRIVNVASIAGLHGAPYVAHYVTAKHALVGLTRALAAEYASKGITVNAVCPGYVDTDLVRDALVKISTKTGLSADDALATILRDAGQSRLITPREVAAAVLAFCAPNDTTTGQAIALLGEAL